MKFNELLSDQVIASTVTGYVLGSILDDVITPMLENYLVFVKRYFVLNVHEDGDKTKPMKQIFLNRFVLKFILWVMVISIILLVNSRTGASSNFGGDFSI